ncbi:MAG TPA: hypothetical protein VNS63_08450 [Blastocatellia bacterium]|nr:hypothetical protein [Blastocatellia bacterium]
MNIVKTICPECEARLEFPADLDNVVCSGCGATHRVKDYNGAISLQVVRTGPVEWEDQGRAANKEKAANQEALAELDELIDEVKADIEAVRAREQSAPLQMGCAAFGIFCLVLCVIAGFMLVGRSLVGGALFYLALILVTIIGIARIRRKLKTEPSPATLRRDRLSLEETLAEFEAERSRLGGR